MLERSSEPKFDKLVLILVIASVLFVIALSAYLAISRNATIAAVSLFVNSGFSGFLVYLYLRMVKTQERQQELLKAQHTPLLEVGPVDVVDGEINLSLMNSGNGPVQNITLKSELQLKDCDEYAGALAESSLSKNIPQGPEKGLVSHLQMGDSLKPTEGKQHFSTWPKFRIVLPDGEYYSGKLEDCLEIVLEGVDSVSFRFSLVVSSEDLFEESMSEEIIVGETNGIEEPLRWIDTYEMYGVHPRN